MEGLGREAVRRHDTELVGEALARLGEVEDLELYGPRDPEIRAGVLSFNFPGVHPHDLSAALDAEGLAVRAGHHCAQPKDFDEALSGATLYGIAENRTFMGTKAKPGAMYQTVQGAIDFWRQTGKLVWPEVKAAASSTRRSWNRGVVTAVRERRRAEPWRRSRGAAR